MSERSVTLRGNQSGEVPAARFTTSTVVPSSVLWWYIDCSAVVPLMSLISTKYSCPGLEREGGR